MNNMVGYPHHDVSWDNFYKRYARFVAAQEEIEKVRRKTLVEARWRRALRVRRGK